MRINIINILFLMLIFIGSLIFNDFIFNIFLFILTIFSLRELLFIRTGEKKYPIEIELIAYVIVIFLTMSNHDSLEYYFIDYKILVILLLSGFIPLVLINNKKKYSILDALYLIGSILFVGTTFNLLLHFRTYNVYYVSYIILIALTTTLFEYIITILIGKKMFLPTINPKKSLEGVLGGITLGTIISTIFFISIITTDLPMYVLIIISFLLSIFGEFGNTVFTFIKKEFNKSNFSNYNFKFGGILDIIDSVVFITLTFMLFVTIL